MKTVVFAKDHLEHEKGKEHEVTDEQAHYFERCGVAVVKKEEKAHTAQASKTDHHSGKHTKQAPKK